MNEVLGRRVMNEAPYERDPSDVFDVTSYRIMFCLINITN